MKYYVSCFIAVAYVLVAGLGGCINVHVESDRQDEIFGVKMGDKDGRLVVELAEGDDGQLVGTWSGDSGLLLAGEFDMEVRFVDGDGDVRTVRVGGLSDINARGTVFRPGNVRFMVVGERGVMLFHGVIDEDEMEGDIIFMVDGEEGDVMDAFEGFLDEVDG